MRVEFKEAAIAKIGEFFTCARHIHARGMRDVINELKELIVKEGLSFSEFKKEIEDLAGSPVPSDDPLFLALEGAFKE